MKKRLFFLPLAVMLCFGSFAKNSINIKNIDYDQTWKQIDSLQSTLINLLTFQFIKVESTPKSRFE